MTMARNQIVHEGEREVFHCMVRCVRRAFLCGDDPYDGQNYDHRKKWIQDRLGLLCQAFGIDLLTYAVMSNHVHTVLRTRPDRVQLWNDEEVARRWLSVYVPKHITANGITIYEIQESDVTRLLSDASRIKELRNRLSSLSWFMKALNEFIARRANREDGCRGRFWESRFKSQRLIDESAILACMCYVDLNPVRAKLADSLESSTFTGIYDRIQGQKAAVILKQKTSYSIDEMDLLNESVLLNDRLVDLDSNESPFALVDQQAYLSLVDWTGRQLRNDKPGVIDPTICSLLESLDFDVQDWSHTITTYRTLFGPLAGTISHLRTEAANIGKCWLKGCRCARCVFRSTESQTAA